MYLDCVAEGNCHQNLGKVVPIETSGTFLLDCFVAGAGIVMCTKEQETDVLNNDNDQVAPYMNLFQKIFFFCVKSSVLHHIKLNLFQVCSI